MFTGIIEATAKIVSLDSGKLTLERPKIFDDVMIGSSIAVSGTCLSVVAFDKNTMTFDVVPMTLSKSKLGTLKPGNNVNLERALKANGRFDGHIVQGHCEGVGTVKKIDQEGDDCILRIDVPKNLLPFIVQHGSISIDGVSLTVAEVEGSTVSIAVIPHTLKITTLGTLKKGDQVNVETDVLAKYVLARR